MPVGAVTSVSLKADLSNDAAFPRQLSTVATPLTGETKAAVEKVAVSQSGPSDPGLGSRASIGCRRRHRCDGTGPRRPGIGVAADVVL